MVQINNDGTLNDFGIDARFQKFYQTDNGIVIKGRTISSYQKIEKIIIENHPKLYPTLHLIAWDFGIDSEGNPVFIEGNTIVPGIFWIQLCGGPVFENNRQEVIEYVNKYASKIKWIWR